MAFRRGTLKRNPEKDDSPYTRVAPGFAAECHPERAEIRDGFCKECLALERVKAAGQKLLAQSIEEQAAIAQVMVKDAEYLHELSIEAKRILQERLPEYARMHYDGALIAAREGDTRPAEWALERVTADVPGKGGSAVPVKKETNEGSGVRIVIGVQLGGGQPTPGHVIDVTPENT